MDKKELAFQIKRGLISSPKYIPVWYKYDKEGSEMFKRIQKDSPYYYFHHAEIEVLQDYSKEIVSDLPTPCTLVDLGSGSGVKTRYLIDAFLKKQGSLHYVPVDLSNEFLMETCNTLATEYGDKINITPIAGVYETGIQTMRNVDSAKLIVWFGSLQCNGYQRQIEYLKFMSQHMTEDDILLISTDVTLDESKVKLAYFDPFGLFPKFYLNAVKRLNNEFNGNIDIDGFQLESNFVLQESSDATSYFRCWLRSLKNQSFYIADLQLNLEFSENERLYLHEGEGSSCKYTINQLESLAKKGNLCVHKTWTDKGRRAMFLCLGKLSQNEIHNCVGK